MEAMSKAAAASEPEPASKQADATRTERTATDSAVSSGSPLGPESVELALRMGWTRFPGRATLQVASSARKRATFSRAIGADNGPVSRAREDLASAGPRKGLNSKLRCIINP
jgi:hypothetical protein